MLTRLMTAAVFSCLLASPVLAQTVPDTKSVRVCTGGKSGNYFWAGSEIAKRFSPDLFTSATLVNTNGSLTNLRRLTSNDVTERCDIGFSQSDVMNQFQVEYPGTHEQIGLLKIAYTEYVHIVCPVASGWNTLSDIADAKGTRKMIVGPDGSGTAETWRIMRQADSKKYDAIQRDPSPADYSSAHTVADSKDTCMLWVSGLNSNDMKSANTLSLRNAAGKPALRLISINDTKMLTIKGQDGLPLYKINTISPIIPQNGKPGLYDNLIPNGWFSTSVDLIGISAYIMIRNDYKVAMPRDRLARLLEAIDDAQPTIWARVNPAGSN